MALWPLSSLSGDTLTVMGLSINGRPGDPPISHQPGPACHISGVIKLSAGPGCITLTSRLFHPPAPPTVTFSRLSNIIILRSEVWQRRKPNADMLPGRCKHLLDLTGSTLPQDVCVLFFYHRLPTRWKCEGWSKGNIPPTSNPITADARHQKYAQLCQTTSTYSTIWGI